MFWERMQIYEKHSYLFISKSVIFRFSSDIAWEVVFECLAGPNMLDGLYWCFMLMQIRETPLKPMMFHQNNIREGNKASCSSYYFGSDIWNFSASNAFGLRVLVQREVC